MNERLKYYLDEHNKRDNLRQDDERAKALIEAGLYDRVYSPDNILSDEYPETEWDDEIYVNRFYKAVPIDITDEEYEEFRKVYEREKKFDEEDSDSESYSNPVATALNVIAAIIIIAGLIVGAVCGNVDVGYSHKEFSLAVAMVYWAVALVSGTLIVGLAQIIKLLTAIKNNQK